MIFGSFQGEFFDIQKILAAHKETIAPVDSVLVPPVQNTVLGGVDFTVYGTRPTIVPTRITERDITLLDSREDYYDWLYDWRNTAAADAAAQASIWPCW